MATETNPGISFQSRGATTVKTSHFTGAFAEVLAQVAAGPCLILGMSVTNTGAATVYLQIYDAASAPADASVPVIPPVKILAGDSYARTFPLAIATGVVLVGSSTAATKTVIGASDLFAEVHTTQV